MLRRFSSTRFRRFWSHRTYFFWMPEVSTVNSICFSRICVAKRSRTSLKVLRRFAGTGSSSILPLSMRLISSTSLMRARRCWLDASIFSR